MSNENLTRTTGYEQPVITHNAIVVTDLAPTDMDNNFSTSRGDGYAVRATDTTITLSGVASITTNQIRKVVVDDGTLIRVYEQGHNSVRIAASGTGPFTLTISGAGTVPVPANCSVEVLWTAQDKGFDAPTNSIRSFPVYDLASRRITTPISLLAAAQTFTSSFVAMGPEINVDGFNQIKLWLTITKQQSDQLKVKAMVKHTSGGTAYSVPIAIPVVSGTPAYYDLRAEYVQFTASELAATDYVTIDFKVNNDTPYIQFYIAFGIDGGTDATVDAAYCTYSY